MIEAVADQRSVDRHAFAVGERAVAVDERQGRVGVERRHATLEKLRRPDVVGVEEGEILARRIPRAVVAPGRGPAVGLLEQPDAVAELFHDREGAVSRAVVNANDFEILERLRDDAVDGAGDSRGRIVRRNNYRNARHCGWDSDESPRDRLHAKWQAAQRADTNGAGVTPAQGSAKPTEGFASIRSASALMRGGRLACGTFCTCDLRPARTDSASGTPCSAIRPATRPRDGNCPRSPAVPESARASRPRE